MTWGKKSSDPYFAYLPLLAEIPIIMFYYYIKASNCDQKSTLLHTFQSKKDLKHGADDKRITAF